MNKIRLIAMSAAVLAGFVVPASSQDISAPDGANLHRTIEKASVARVVFYSELIYLTKGTEDHVPGAGEQEQLDGLRLRISKNPAAQAELFAAGLTAQSVVATAVGQSGVLLLYVDDL